RLAALLLVALFAKGRRTVTSWLRAARVGRGFAPYYYFLAALGRQAHLPAAYLLRYALTRLTPPGPLLFALDDTPTQRYGPHVQGAGIHHNPTPALAAQAAVIGRLRKDAGLRTVPRPPRGRRRRGRPPTYGPARISLAKRAGQRRGWQVARVPQYGEVRAKRIKTFEATWRPAGGRIRVVLVHEGHGWLALFSTDAGLTAEEILAAAADRFSIETTFQELRGHLGLERPAAASRWHLVSSP